MGVICKENIDPNILKEKTENIEEEKMVRSSSSRSLIDIMNDQKTQTMERPNKENIPSKNTNRTVHNFPLPFNKMVGNNSKPMDPNKKLLYVDPPTWPSPRKNNKKIEKLITKLSSSKRRNYRSKNRNEQQRKIELKQQKAERRRLQLREQQHDKWQVVAANKKQKREALRKDTEMKIRLQKQELNE